MTDIDNTAAPASMAHAAVDAVPHWRSFAAKLPADRVLWSEVLPGGSHWSWRVSRGTALRFVAMGERANCSVLLYAAHDRLERYSMPDTCKALHTAHFTRGHVLMSDMGRAMASITHDTLGWHDPFGGLLDAARLREKHGEQRYETHRNAMYRAGRDGLLIEIGKRGMSARDLITPVNLFSQVAVDAEGRFGFNAGQRVEGHAVELRCEMDVIVAVSTAPHPLDPRLGYAPGKVGIAAWRSGAAPADDFCRGFRPECARALHNADVFALS